MRTISLYVDGTLKCDIIAADSFLLRLRGLIGRNAEEVGGLLLQPCDQIHTCFMNTPIDVIYLDKNHIVMRLDEAVNPGHFCKREAGACCVLELPAGKAATYGITKGSGLSLR